MEEQKKDVAEKAAETTESTIKDAEVVSTSPETKEEDTPAPALGMNTIFAFVAGLLVAVVGYYLIQGGTPVPADTAADAVGSVDPTEIVATVNGEELDGKALNQQLQQFAQLSGAESFDALDEESKQQLFSQAVDALINSELIAQAAEESGVSVTDEEVEAEYARLVEQIGGEDAATTRLAELGATVEEFKEDLVRDMVIAKYLETESGDQTATEEEVAKAYAMIQESMGENIPPLEEIRTQIEAQVVAEKQQEFLFELLQEMREGADVEVLVIEE